MKQFGKIFKFEFKNYLYNKTFVIITLLIMVIVAGIMFVPRIIEVFDSDDGSQEGSSMQDENTSEEDEFPVMLIKCENEQASELVTEVFSASFIDYDVKVTTDSTDKIKQQITDGEAECAFVMNDLVSYTYYVGNNSMHDINTEIANEALQSVYRMSAMISAGISAEDAQSILAATIESNIEILGKDQMENFLYTYIMIFALYTVILLYGQMVTTGVATEKSSRAMELLVTSANPVSMMFGKVLAACLAGFSQLVCIFGTALICYNINKSYWNENFVIDSIFNMPVSLFVYMLVFFVLGFLIYAFMYGAVGSTVSKLEDVNTSVLPITMLFIVAFFVVMFSLTSGSIDNTLMKVCSYIPFTSPMAMFTRIGMSTVPAYEIVISIAILVISVGVIGVIAAKIYRVGVLMYGVPPKMKEIIKAIRKSA